MESQNIAEQLIKDGYNADALHGDLSQQQRDKVMARYRNRNLQVLVATDVAARGIDVRDITHVIHYHLPDEVENYTHRSGRTARAGKSGISIALVNIREKDKIRQIEKKINRKFHLSKVPDAGDIGEQQLLHFVKKIHDVQVNEKAIDKFMAPVFKELEDLTKEDIIKRIVTLEFSRFLEDYRNAPDINVDLAHPGKSTQERYRNAGPRMFINLGTADGLDKGSMLGYLLDGTKLDKSKVGKIDMKPVYSFIEFEDEESLEKTLNAFDGEFYNGRKVRVDRSGEKDKKEFKKDYKKDFKRDYKQENREQMEKKDKKGWGEKPANRTDGKKKKYKSSW